MTTSTTRPNDRIQEHRLHVAAVLHSFIQDKVLPGTGIAPEAFWKGFDAVVADLAPKNIALLAERDRLQAPNSVCITLGQVSAKASDFAAQNRITLISDADLVVLTAGAFKTL